MIAIRRAIPDDFEKLTHIAFEAKRVWDYPEEWILMWSEDLTISKNLIRNNLTLKALSNEEILGFILVKIAEDNIQTHSIEHLWVKPDQIGKGIGKSLFIEALAKLNHENKIEVCSDPNAQGFYEKLGFKFKGWVSSQPAGRKIPILIRA